MAPDQLHREDTRPDDGESDATRRIHRGVEEPVETTKPEQPKGLMARSGRHMSGRGTGGGSQRKGSPGQQRVWTGARGCWSWRAQWSS